MITIKNNERLSRAVNIAENGSIDGDEDDVLGWFAVAPQRAKYNLQRLIDKCNVITCESKEAIDFDGHQQESICFIVGDKKDGLYVFGFETRIRFDEFCTICGRKYGLMPPMCEVDPEIPPNWGLTNQIGD